ncbi:hypothetical protein ACOSQ3_026606 [Xanthoceras sorbifolium]
MDGHYVPTSVNMLYSESNSNQSLTWVDWSRGDAHPRKFGWSEIGVEFLNRIRDGSECTCVQWECYLLVFSRKFLPNALEPLLRERTDPGAEVGRACCELIPKDGALAKGLGGASGLIPEERLIWMKGGATGGWSGRRDVSTTMKGGLGGATGGWSGRKGAVDDDWAVSRLTVAVVGGLRR